MRYKKSQLLESLSDFRRLKAAYPEEVIGENEEWLVVKPAAPGRWHVYTLGSNFEPFYSKYKDQNFLLAISNAGKRIILLPDKETAILDGGMERSISGVIFYYQKLFPLVREYLDEETIEKAELYIDGDYSDIEEEVWALAEAEVVHPAEIEDLGYASYGLNVYEVDGKEYAIGNDEEADDAAREYIIDSMEYFNKDFINRHIDSESMKSWFGIEESIRDSPEFYSYYLGDPEEDEDLRLKLDELNNRLEELNDEKDGLDEEEDAERISQLEEMISELEDEIYDAESDLENSKEYSDKQFEDAAERYWSENIEGNEFEYLTGEIGYPEDEAAKIVMGYIDEDEFVKDAIQSDGRGHFLSPYDSNENEIFYNDTWYFYYRIN